MTENEPRLHVDTDWKAEAQAEKERLAADEKARTEAAAGAGAPGGPGARELPEASFRALMGVLVSQALLGLGTIQDPESKGVVIDLEGSRFAIDLLAVLEEKTKGNIADDEAEELRHVIAELRARFVQLTNLVAQSATVAPGADPTGPGP